VALWRAEDRALIAGDALATADLDSWTGLIGQKPKISRPASPFTFDWEKARESVQVLAALKPALLACGHGEPMKSVGIAEDLEAFAAAFAPPTRGRYVSEPATTNEHGVIYEPPAPADHLPKIAAGVVAGMFVVAGVFFGKRGKRATPSRE
jgi:glyoxylase-like metal-dependent hydrolase (beta-lactamase superfamily II)